MREHYKYNMESDKRREGQFPWSSQALHLLQVQCTLIISTPAKGAITL